MRAARAAARLHGVVRHAHASQLSSSPLTRLPLAPQQTAWARRQRTTASGAAPAWSDAALASPPPQLSPAESAAALSAARAAPSRPGRLFAAAAVAPGSRLLLRLPATRAQVAVLPGPAGELVIEAEWESLPAQHSAAQPLAASIDAHGLVLSDGGTASSPLKRAVVRAWVPERFASVAVSTRGGGVSVCSLTEADCKVDTGGGHAALGAVRGAAHAVVRTRGGDATARALGAARVALDTAGGSAHVGRVVGRAVALVTQGGDAHLGVVFADRLRLRTAGGAAVLESLRVGLTAALDTGGGTLTLRALDGAPGTTAEMATHGGAADVALEGPAAGMAATRLSTAGGAADVALPPGWPARLAVNGDDVAPPGAEAVFPPAQTRREGAAPAVGAGLRIDAGAGDVRLRARTWLEGALAASARKKAEAAEATAAADTADLQRVQTAPFMAASPARDERGIALPLRVLFDGECPLCVAEINALRRRAERRAAGGTPAVLFVDIAAPEYRAADHGGVSYEAAMASIHALTPDGRVLRGVQVFSAMYDAVGLGWLMAPTKWPRLAALAERTYEYWAQRRLWLTGRPGMETVLAARRAREAAGGDTCGAACEREPSGTANRRDDA
jgi:predicted DCC family thiol-disulfide oxidoreductase YuxK